MTKLEELINELCPDGVENKNLGDMCQIRTGKLNANAKDDNGKYPFFTCDANPYRINNYAFDTSAILISGNGSQVGHINSYEGKFNAYQRTYVLDKFKFIEKAYLFHYLRAYLKDYIMINCKKGSVPYITLPMLQSFKVPVSPMEVQDEIVKILDNFTELTAELTAELAARQKQYAFYRDYLLDFRNEDVTKKIPDIDCSNVEYKRLGDIATAIYRGAGIKRDEVTETGIPCVRYGEIYTTYNVTFNNCVSHTDEDKIQNKKYFEHGDVLFAITGESVEEIAKSCVYLGHDKCLAGGDIVVLKHNQNPKYMAYVLSTTNAQSQKSKGKVKSKVVHSSVPALSDIIIPIPPLSEQEKIANMIERFDHLCNDISNGLPAEIEARKNQYEYYRDTLLSFDDKACSHIVKVERERANTQ